MASSTSTAAETASKIKELLKPPTPLIESIDAQRLDQLRRIFSNLISTKQFDLNEKKESEASQKWNSWLKKHHNKFLDQLQDAVTMGRKSALRTFMGVIASAPTKVAHSERVDDKLVFRMLRALVDSYGNDGDGIVPEYMLEMLQLEFLKYRDAQYYMMMSMKQIADSLGNEEVDGVKAENLSRILMKIHIGYDQDDLTPENVKKDGDGGTCSNFLFLPSIHEAGVGENEDEDDGHDEDLESSDESSHESEVDEPSPKKKQKVEKRTKKKPELSPWQSVRQHR